MKISDESIIKSDPNETQDSKANRLETPEDVYYNIVDTLSQLGIDPPKLDGKPLLYIQETSSLFFIFLLVSFTHEGESLSIHLQSSFNSLLLGSE